MRILQVTHGFPPRERTGVETHTADLSRELTRAGDEVHVLCATLDPDRSHLSTRTTAFGDARVHWLALNEPPRNALEELVRPGVARAFEELVRRERIELVHFQHFVKLGIGPLESAVELGLPTLFTAHDFGSVCHRLTHLRPDLSLCDRFSDPQACARCDLAVAHLNGVPELGDWHMGVLPGDLDPARARRLEELLDHHSAPPELEERTLLRVELESRRRAAISALDRVLVPSRFLFAVLEQELSHARLEHWENPTTVTELAALRPPRPPAGRRPVFGFVGSVTKHKGLHVLLEAFRGLESRAELVIHGDSNDRRYVERQRVLAREVGARWNGAFDAAQRSRVLGELDALCVPSLWEENAPLTVLEARAARRAVLASRLGGLVEQVAHERDGLLVAPGDVLAWRATLERCLATPELLGRLASAGARPIDLVPYVERLRSLYAELILARQGLTRSTVALASLAPVEELRRALGALSFDALGSSVSNALDGLRQDHGLGPSALTPILRSPLAQTLRERARDSRREAEWRAESAAYVASERDDLRGRTAAHERELVWLREERASFERERDALRGETEVLQRLVDELRAAAERWSGERDALSLERERMLDERRRLHAERQTLAEELERRERDLRAHRDHLTWLEKELRRLGEYLGGEPGLSLSELVLQMQREGQGRGIELAWRRLEMDRLREIDPSLWGLWRRRRELRERFERWDRPPGGASR